MTFKHTNDTPMMRSLTKVAQDKGWIKEEPVVKTAAAKLDLVPTNDLLENVLKLCSGLRAAGFEKQANDIEDKFVVYKQAQSLYDVGGEKGEDLIHAAHPKGSHKLEGVEGNEATFEDILDKHNKFLNVVENKPTGKLASSQDVISAVKQVLTAVKVVTAADNLDNLYGQAKAAFQKFRQAYGNIAMQMGEDSNRNDNYFDILRRELDNKAVYNSQGLASALSETLNNFKSSMAPGFFGDAAENQKWEDVITPMFEIANRYAEQFRGIISDILKIETTAKTESIKKQYDPDAPAGEVSPGVEAPNLQIPEIEMTSNPVDIKGTTLINTLKAYESAVTVAKNSKASLYIKTQTAEIQDVMDRYERAEKTGQLATIKQDLIEEMNTKEIEVKDFYNRVVHPGPAQG